MLSLRSSADSSDNSEQMSAALFVIPALLLCIILSALVFAIHILRRPLNTSRHAYAHPPEAGADEDLELNLQRDPTSQDEDEEYAMASVTISPSSSLLHNNTNSVPHSQPPDYSASAKPTFAALTRFFTLPFSSASSHSHSYSRSHSNTPPSASPSDTDLSSLPPPPSFSAAHPESSTIQDRSIASARKRQQLRANIELHKLLWDAGLLSGPQPEEVEAEVERQRRREERRRRRRREERENGRSSTGEALPSYSEKEGEGEVVLGKGEDRRHDDEGDDSEDPDVGTA